MEPHQTSDDSADDEAFLHHELEDIIPDPSVDAERPLTKRTKRQYWMVQVRNNEGEEKERPMRVRDVFHLPRGERVVIPFDGHTPCGTDANGLLGGFLGRLAQDYRRFPICFDSWPLLLEDYKTKAWTDIIKAKLWWDPVHEAAAKTYILKDIGKKWRENRLKLFNTYYDLTKSHAENTKNSPLSISQTEWATYIDYRLRDKTKIVTIGDLKPEPVLWHEDFGRRREEHGRKNPPGSMSGRELGDAAHRLVVNSLQVKNRIDANGYHRPINGPMTSYAAPVGHRQPLPPYNYESRPGYVAMPPPLPVPPLRGQPQSVPYTAVPTAQYGYDQPYSPPTMHNPHHQSNSYARNDYQHPRSHPYERNSHHVSGGSSRHGYPSSEIIRIPGS